MDLYDMESNIVLTDMQERFVFAHFFSPDSREGRFRLALLDFPEPAEQIELVRRKNIPLEDILHIKGKKNYRDKEN